MGLDGKVVVVTGAGRGLGAAFALALADVGCELVLCGRRMSDLEASRQAVLERGSNKVDCVVFDLADAGSVDRAIAQMAAFRPKVDILINNGAMWLEARADPYDDSEVLGVINAAVTGTFLFTQGLRPLMEASDAPDVVTIGSVSGLTNSALQGASVPFYAAKRGQVALADGFRQVFAGTKFRSILVNPPDLDDARPDQPEWEKALNRHKGQRATSRDVVEAVIFALSRPRHVSLTVDIDTDDGGLFPRPDFGWV